MPCVTHFELTQKRKQPQTVIQYQQALGFFKSRSSMIGETWSDYVARVSVPYELPPDSRPIPYELPPDSQPLLYEPPFESQPQKIPKCS